MGSCCSKANKHTLVQVLPLPVPDEKVLQVANPWQIQLLWTVQHSSLLLKLRFNIVREVSSYLPERHMPVAVSSTGAQYFDIASDTWHSFCSLKREICVDASSATVLLGGHQVFVCGGYYRKHALSFAYLLKSQGYVNLFSEMSYCRCFPGVVYDECANTVYVFGGFGHSVDSEYKTGTWKSQILRSSEKFLLSSLDREDLPDMCKGRYGFNPCINSSIVYICGGHTPCVETYDTKTNKFTILPNFLIQGNSCCIAVIQAETLTVICDSYLYKRKVHEQSKSASRSHSSICTWSRCTPVLTEGKLFIVTPEEGRCMRIDLETGEWDKIVLQV